MRPIKQVGVVSSHAILFFAAATATVSSGAALLLSHVSREGFFFISACMLAYTYEDLHLAEETVKGHVRNILAKLGANDRTHAVTIALERAAKLRWLLGCS